MATKDTTIIGWDMPMSQLMASGQAVMNESTQNESHLWWGFKCPHNFRHFHFPLIVRNRTFACIALSGKE
jgi:hypothetical protein